MFPTRGLFLLFRLTDKISTCTTSHKVGWKLCTDLRVITFLQHSPLIMSRWGFLKQNLQNVSELRHALFMTEFTVENLSFQDNYRQILESIICQWLCEDVCKLIFRLAKFQTNFFVVHQLSYEMKPCVDVLGYLVKHMIL